MNLFILAIYDSKLNNKTKNNMQEIVIPRQTQYTICVQLYEPANYFQQFISTIWPNYLKSSDNKNTDKNTNQYHDKNTNQYHDKNNGQYHDKNNGQYHDKNNGQYDNRYDNQYDNQYCNTQDNQFIHINKQTNTIKKLIQSSVLMTQVEKTLNNIKIKKKWCQLYTLLIFILIILTFILYLNEGENYWIIIDMYLINMMINLLYISHFYKWADQNYKFATYLCISELLKTPNWLLISITKDTIDNHNIYPILIELSSNITRQYSNFIMLITFYVINYIIYSILVYLNYLFSVILCSIVIIGYTFYSIKYLNSIASIIKKMN